MNMGILEIEVGGDGPAISSGIGIESYRMGEEDTTKATLRGSLI